MAVYFFNPRNSKTSRHKNWQSSCRFNCNGLKDGKLQCDCGENLHVLDWCWEKQSGNTVVLSGDDREAFFHPIYSSGTAAVKGTDSFKQNLHHYFEVKVLTKLYGTDIMIGVGTSKVSLDEQQYKFCSMLGYDDQSWGYSYHGLLQHDKLFRKYGPIFGLGSIIGVHLDMYTGTLEYYLNRKPLGIAFKGLKGLELYPMVCSTAAQSAIKLTCSLSLTSTLQLKCLMVIKKYPHLVKHYHSIPGMSRLIKGEYCWLIPPEVKSTKEKNELTLQDEAVLPLSTILQTSSRHRKRLRTNTWCRIAPKRENIFERIHVVPNSVDQCCIHNCTVTPTPSDESKLENRSNPSTSNEVHDSLIKNMQTQFQEAFRNLSNTIELMNDVSKEVVTDMNENRGTVEQINENEEETDKNSKGACCHHNCIKDVNQNSMDDDIDKIIIKHDGYLTCAPDQDDFNLTKPSSSSMIYDNLDDENMSHPMETDLPNMESRNCEICHFNLGSGRELSQDMLCSICDVII